MKIGDRFTFTQHHHRVKYGPGGVVTRLHTSVDRPHPGRVHRDWIVARTDNGTELNWPVGQFSRSTVAAAPAA